MKGGKVSPDYGREPTKWDYLSTNDSMKLVSSSKYLNHPGLRNWVSTNFLRSEDVSYDDYADGLELYHICRELTDTNKVNEAFRRARQNDPVLDKWFERAYLCDYSDLDDLSSLPAGTLGREFHDAFIAKGMTPDFLPSFKPEHEADYWLRRAQQTHDIHHLITGCATNSAGEIRILGVYLGNWSTHLPADVYAEVTCFNVIHLSAWMMRIGLQKPSAWPHFQAALAEGLQLGASMSAIYLPDYEQMWEVPVERIRQDMNVSQPPRQVDTAAVSRMLEEA